MDWILVFGPTNFAHTRKFENLKIDKDIASNIWKILRIIVKVVKDTLRVLLKYRINPSNFIWQN
jgi:hypothetical protein